LCRERHGYLQCRNSPRRRRIGDHALGNAARSAKGAAVNLADVQIRGRGAVATSLALALSQRGLRVALSTRQSADAAGPDVRAYALNAASRNLLQRLKVWDAMPAQAVTAVYDMRVHGDAHGSRLGFSAWSQCVDALAWIVDAAELDATLNRALQFAAHLERVDHAVDAALTVLAEGKDSASRAALGVDFERHGYGQTAIAARLTSDRTHDGCAHQWFRTPDILALLPFDRPQAGRSYGLVWSLPQEQARAMMALDPHAFETALNEACGGEGGALRLAGERVAWPLSIGRAAEICGPGWVLVGDAAHVVHPLAGQGLNLGFGDVLALCDVLDTREAWRGLGDERLLRRYARSRALPTAAMARLTDGLLHLFATEQPLLRELRNRGMTLVNRAGPVKRWLTAQALDA
jgi:ubiquinone biosynthesis UbiH/UbiF/VisC/COQ6 family hydroxylase